MPYLDLPTTADITDLAAHRNDLSVSIFLPTTPVSLETDADRILLKNLVKEALDQLQAADADRRRVNPLIEEVEDLIDDDEFWRFQAHGLAIYVTPDNLRTFRVPNALYPLGQGVRSLSPQAAAARDQLRQCLLRAGAGGRRCTPD